jgi:hypothetical protein
MLKKKYTSLITLTLLLTIAGTAKPLQASFIAQSTHKLNSEQLAQATTSTEPIDSANGTNGNSQAKSKFPWWSLVLVAFVPFLGWFFLGRDRDYRRSHAVPRQGRDRQVNQEAVIKEDFSATLDSTSTSNGNYSNNTSEVANLNNLTSQANTDSEDSHVMTGGIATASSNLANELQQQANSVTKGISQTNIDEVEQLSQLETDLTATFNQDESNLLQDVEQTPASFSIDLEKELTDEVEQLSQLETDLTATVNQDESNFLDRNNTVNEVNNFQEQENDFSDDKIGNISEWLEQLNITTPSSTSNINSSNSIDNLVDENNNLDNVIDLNEDENNQDLVSFEQLLFEDLDNSEDSKNQS